MAAGSTIGAPILEQARRTPGVTSASPLIEQPLMASHEGRVEAILLRGMPREDILNNQTIAGNVLAGSLASLRPGSNNVAIGSRLAELLGAQVGSTITIISPAGPHHAVRHRAADRRLSTSPRSSRSALYDFDKAFVIMPMEEAQNFLMMGDSIGMIEVDDGRPRPRRGDPGAARRAQSAAAPWSTTGAR